MNKQREQTIERVKKQLLKRGSPRLLMTLFLSLTGCAGFLVSYALLRVGVTRMMLRYPLAILSAYCVFLLLLRFWLFLHARRMSDEKLSRGELEDAARKNSTGSTVFDVLDVVTNSGGTSHIASGGETFGFSATGGDAAGAGAGINWSEGADSSVAGNASSVGGAGLDLDLDELWFLVLALIAICGALIASLYVVFIAPALLAEILVDGLLVTTLYKRMKNVEQRNWLRSALAKTWLPLTFVVLFFIVAGYFLQKAAPDAHSIGGVWTSVTADGR